MRTKEIHVIVWAGEATRAVQIIEDAFMEADIEWDINVTEERG